MAITVDTIAAAFNSNYMQLAGTQAQITHVGKATYRAHHKGHGVDFEVDPTTSNMQIVGISGDAARALWRLVK